MDFLMLIFFAWLLTIFHGFQFHRHWQEIQTMSESNSIDKIDMSDFDIEISSDEDEDFVPNSNIVGNIEGNPVSTAETHSMIRGKEKMMKLRILL